MKLFLLMVAALCAAWSAVSAQTEADVQDAEFARYGDLILTLDLYLPEKQGPAMPVVVWLHGGGWSSGSKEEGKNIAGFLGPLGFAIVSPTYRLSDTALYPAQIQDCKAAIRWIRTHAEEYNLDPERIGVWGASAGGHLAALLGASGGVRSFTIGQESMNLENTEGQQSEISSTVQAVCAWFPPVDLLRMNDYPSRIDHDAADAPSALLLGAPVQTVPERAWLASPLSYISPDDPPFLIQHGTADSLVPYQQSIILDSALQAQGVESTLILIDGGGHGGLPFQSDTTNQRVIDFFRQHLRHPATDVPGYAPPAVPQGQTLTIAPHPARDFTTLHFALPAPGMVTVTLYTLDGRLLVRNFYEVHEPGNQSLQLDVRGLPYATVLGALELPNALAQRFLLHLHHAGGAGRQ